MPLWIRFVSGVGLTLLLGACATSESMVLPTQAAESEVLAAPSGELSMGPAPDGEPFSIGPAAADTIGGYLPDGRTLSPFDAKNPIIAWLDPPLLAAVQDAAGSAASDGIDMQITSGWRTRGFQQRLFDDAVRTYGSDQIAQQYVASPDTSAHVVGHAVDVGPTEADNWLIRNGSRFGLCQIYANEIWHFELAVDQNGDCPPLLPNAAG
jgi:D-alanyl-D-alanine carboxypeptidase